MTVELLVRGGQCVFAEGIRPADLAIGGGRIIAVAEPGALSADSQVLDARGLLVLAGAIDAHVHVREPGQTHKEDYAHASRAAAVGGVTTLISQPNTDPAVTDLRALDAVIQAGRASRVDHAVCAGIRAAAPDRLAAAELARAGVVAFEVLDDTGTLDGQGWLDLFDAVAPTGLPLAYLAADRAVMRRNLARARGRRGASWRDFSRVVSGDAEVLGYQRAVALARICCEVPVIVRQVTTAAGLDALRRAKDAPGGGSVFVEVNVHHLFLTDDDLERLGPFGQMIPPPRPASDVAALWRGVRDSTVDFISTDHAPHTREEKEQGRRDLWTAPTGVPGLDSMLCLLLDAALESRLSLPRLTELVSAAPARIHRLGPAKGALTVGADADLVLVDPAAEWSLDAGRLFTRCGWSGFEGRRGRGALVATLVRGALVARQGQPVDEPLGRWVRPEGGGPGGRGPDGAQDSRGLA